jgi:hypothetical protein
MGRSAADTPTSPEFLRVSDVDRDRAVDELKQEFVDGRLSHDTFMMRMQAALGARNSGQLSGLLDDLPPRSSGLGRIRAAVRRAAQAPREMLGGAVAGLLPGGSAGTPGGDWDDPVPLAFPRGEGTTFTIGRHRDCDLHIADMSVSRVHAQLERNAGGWLLSDLGSTNGTRLNGWRVRAPVLLRPGDQIKFGNAEFVIQGHGSGSGSGEALGEAAPGDTPLA